MAHVDSAADHHPPPVATLRISVACCWAPSEVRLVQLLLPVGATVAQALQASGMGVGDSEEAVQGDVPHPPLKVGVWGHAVRMSTVLRDHDRVEIYRPLLVDPKEARRLRYRRTRQRPAPQG